MPSKQENVILSFGFKWDNEEDAYMIDSPYMDRPEFIRFHPGGPELFSWDHYDTGQMDQLSETFTTFDELIKFLNLRWDVK
jgi:hypothetical protein